MRYSINAAYGRPGFFPGLSPIKRYILLPGLADGQILGAIPSGTAWLVAVQMDLFNAQLLTPPHGLNRWGTRETLTRISYERVISFRFPSSSPQPSAAGSSWVRKEKAKEKKDSFLSPSVIDPVEDSEPGESGIKGPVVHKMSTRTADKIRNKITAMYNVGMAKTFVTLTMVNSAADRVAVRCLQKLLKHWRDQWGTFNYLWVAERQQDTGNVHFHLVLDRKLDVQKENLRWVRMQWESGIQYTATHYKKVPLQNHVLIDPTAMNAKQCAVWLNPLDVKYINSSHGLSMYLAGYVTKSIGEQFECRIWHCSKTVSALFTSIMTGADTHENLLKTLPGAENVYVYTRDVVNKKTGKVLHKKGDIIIPQDCINEHCSWVWLVNKEATKKYVSLLTDLNNELVAGTLTKDRIIYYTYEKYADAYLRPEHMSHKTYLKLCHSWKYYDARKPVHVKSRGLDYEQDFYQFGKAFRDWDELQYLWKKPTFDYRGKRWYGKKELTKYLINYTNKIIYEHFAEKSGH